MWSSSFPFPIELLNFFSVVKRLLLFLVINCLTFSTFFSSFFFLLSFGVFFPNLSLSPSSFCPLPFLKMVKSYLRYVPTATWGVIASRNCNCVYGEDEKGKQLIFTGSLRTVSAWSVSSCALVCFFSSFFESFLLFFSFLSPFYHHSLPPSITPPKLQPTFLHRTLSHHAILPPPHLTQTKRNSNSKKTQTMELLPVWLWLLITRESLLVMKMEQ